MPPRARRAAADPAWLAARNLDVERAGIVRVKSVIDAQNQATGGGHGDAVQISTDRERDIVAHFSDQAADGHLGHGVGPAFHLRAAVRPGDLGRIRPVHDLPAYGEANHLSTTYVNPGVVPWRDRLHDSLAARSRFDFLGPTRGSGRDRVVERVARALRVQIDARHLGDRDG